MRTGEFAALKPEIAAAVTRRLVRLLMLPTLMDARHLLPETILEPMFLQTQRFPCRTCRWNLTVCQVTAGQDPRVAIAVTLPPRRLQLTQCRLSLSMSLRATGAAVCAGPKEMSVPLIPVCSGPGFDQSQTPLGKIWFRRVICSGVGLP